MAVPSRLDVAMALSAWRGARGLRLALLHVGLPDGLGGGQFGTDDVGAIVNIGDLIEELKQYPELSSVFVQSADGEIRHLDSVHQLWAKHGDGWPGPVTETRGDDGSTFEADDYGALLYG